MANKFVPVMMGSAFKNRGVQLALDGVCRYLPDPSQVNNTAIELDADGGEGKEVIMQTDSDKPLVCYSFKLEEGRYGQLTYVRIYQGTLKRGDYIKNNKTGEKVRVQRLVRMHSNEMEELQSAGAGEICALFGVECDSGTTFTDPALDLTCSSMHVPEPVISLAIMTKDNQITPAFSKGREFVFLFCTTLFDVFLSFFWLLALKRFQREDPTFRVHQDEESGEIIISGMGELHLEIYTERMKREYGLDVVTGQPKVAFRETIQAPVKFDHTLKKQSGGQGQFARVVGELVPMDEKEGESNKREGVVFIDHFLVVSLF